MTGIPPGVRLLHPTQLPPVTDWAEEALCAQADPETWFPPVGGTTRPAIAVCTRCPVRVLCLETALAYERLSDVSVVGVWGCATATQRRQMLRGLPGLCDLCPNERDRMTTLCSPCAAARLAAWQADYHRDYARDRRWEATA